MEQQPVQAASSGVFSVNEFCHWANIGRTAVYAELKASSWPPIDDWNQYHRVMTINNGQVRDVCDFRFESKVSGY